MKHPKLPKPAHAEPFDLWVGRDSRRFSYDTGTLSLGELAVSLSRICRFAGHLGNAPIEAHFSVAEHSVHVAQLAQIEGREDLAPFCLLHDATEALISDMPKPWKDRIERMGLDIRGMEDEMLGRIVRHLGVAMPSGEDARTAKTYDKAILSAECVALHGELPPWDSSAMLWGMGSQVDVCQFWPTGTAFDSFIATAVELGL